MNDEPENDGITDIETPLGDEIESGSDHVQDEGCNHEPDDSMDGDHDSAMASAGFGTDEDYGYYDGE